MEGSTNNTRLVGLIAGSKLLPIEFARIVKQTSHLRIIAVGFEGETDPALEGLVDELHWIRVGQLGRLIKVFKQAGVRQCVMLGQVAPRNIFETRLDLRALGVLLRLKEKNAHTIFGAVAEELAKDGIELVDPRPWLKPLMPSVGFRMGPPIDSRVMSDLEFGYRIAKEIARLDIGQTVVVKRGVVLAVEGFEGTDQCILRGGELAGKKGGAVAVKVAKEGHDMRFDIPCIGPETVLNCSRAGVSVLGFEGDKTLVLDRLKCENLCARFKVSILAI
jgi:DUF1009 family protein